MNNLLIPAVGASAQAPRYRRASPLAADPRDKRHELLDGIDLNTLAAPSPLISGAATASALGGNRLLMLAAPAPAAPPPAAPQPRPGAHGEAVSAGILRRLQDAGLSDADVDMHAERAAFLAATFAALAHMPKPTPQHVLAAVGHALANDRADADAMAGEIARMPQDGPALRKWCAMMCKRLMLAAVHLADMQMRRAPTEEAA